MSHRKYRQYLETKVKTAGREELLLMLYDGMLRFLEEARSHIGAGHIEPAGNAMIKVQNILMELLCALKAEENPVVAGKLQDLYIYMYTRLSETGSRESADIVDEIRSLIVPLRAAWGEAIQTLKQAGECPPAQAPHGAISPDSRNAAINFQA